MAADTGFAHLETPRLVLRRFRPQDAEAFAAYRSDPAVARYQSWQVPFTPVQARRFIAGLADAHPGEPGEWFQFAVELRATGELVGDCAATLQLADERQAQIGYTLAAAHHRRGLGTELVSRLLDYLVDEHDVHRVWASLDPDNVPSVRLLERLGWRREGHLVESYWNGAVWRDDLLYAVLAREWRAVRRAAARQTGGG
jgi:RimJ/RimL family protein N-acetyltransferase